MKKIFTFWAMLILSAFIGGEVLGQQWEDVLELRYAEIKDIKVDDNGNKIVAGVSNRFGTAGDIKIEQSIVVSDESAYIFFVLKLDSENNVLWFRKGYNLEQDNQRYIEYADIDFDKFGNINVIFSSDQICNLIVWNGIEHRDKDNILISLDSNGTTRWQQSWFAKNGHFSANSYLKCDIEGNTYALINVRSNHTLSNRPPTPITVDGTDIFINSEYDRRGSDTNLLLLKFNVNGNLVWNRHAISSGGYNSEFTTRAIDIDNVTGRVILYSELDAGKVTFSNSDKIIERSGDFIHDLNGWLCLSVYSPEGVLLQTQVLSKEGRDIFSAGRGTELFSVNSNVYMYGDKQRTKVYPNGFTAYFYRPFVRKLTQNFDTQWTYFLHDQEGMNCDFIIHNLYVDKSENIYIYYRVEDIEEDFRLEIGNRYFNLTTENTYMFVIKIDKNGEFSWVNQVYENSRGYYTRTKLIGNNTGDLCLFGYYGSEFIIGNRTMPILSIPESNKGGHQYIARIKDNSHYYTPTPFFINGKTFIDKNSNCILDSQDEAFPNVIIKSNNTYQLSDNEGRYFLPLSDGTHILESKVIDNNFFRAIPNANQCDSIKEVVIENGELQDPNSINFGYKVKPCSYLTIDVENARRRRCFMSNTTVEYQNKGFATASNVEVKVEYPDYIRPITSSVDWTRKEGNTYFFTIGNLNAGEVGKIVLQDSVVCGIEAIRGLTQCVIATISPANSCEDWTDNENNYVVSGRCAGAGVVRFVVSNFTSTSLESVPYRLFADSEVLKEGNLSLSSTDVAELEVFSDAKTIRIEVFPPNHNRISAAVEGCQTNTNYLTKTQATAQSVGLSASPVSQSAVALPQDDGGERMEKACSEILDSYDPNDKQVTPFGLTRDNLIEKTTELEYMVRFQNTGTDTAYRVVVLDTLSSFLDIETIRLGMSSHNYRFFVDGNEDLQVLRFEFENINLPDSNTNEPASNGFIKFKINQKSNNNIGTVIKNRAAIYFDFNSPIITNSTSNKIAILPLRNSSLNLPVFNCSDTNFELVANAGEDIQTNNQTATLAAQRTGVAGRWSILEGFGTLEDASKNNSKISGLYPLSTSLVWSVSVCSQSKSDTVLVRSTNENYTLPIAYDETARTLSIPTGNVTYQWYKDGVAINGQTEAILNLSNLNDIVGVFTVVVSANGESITSEPFLLDAVLSNEELIAATEIIAYPNPTESILNISLSNRLVGSNLSLINMLGVTLNQTIETTSNKVQLKVDTIPSGVYFVRIISKYGTFHKKIIIKR